MHNRGQKKMKQRNLAVLSKLVGVWWPCEVIEPGQGRTHGGTLFLASQALEKTHERKAQNHVSSAISPLISQHRLALPSFPLFLRSQKPSTRPQSGDSSWLVQCWRCPDSTLQLQKHLRYPWSCSTFSSALLWVAVRDLPTQYIHPTALLWSLIF